jgi:hypothetical protein
MRRLIVAVIALGLVAAACSSDEPELVGIRASNDPSIGDSRFLFGVHEISGARRGSPDEAVSVTATSLEASESVFEVDADFLWMVPESIGLYRAVIPFDVPGMWEIDIEISTGERTEPFLVLVAEEPTTVGIGDRAPRVATPTLDDTPVDDLTTDYPIAEAFYELSLDDALENGRKTVAVFATPAYCTSAACGPMMRQVKDLTASYSDVNWVHVEVYQGFNEPGFAPDPDHLAPAVVEYGLLTEPWIFVMDENGIVISRLEGVLGEGELEALLGT